MAQSMAKHSVYALSANAVIKTELFLIKVSAKGQTIDRV